MQSIGSLFIYMTNLIFLCVLTLIQNGRAEERDVLPVLRQLDEGRHSRR